jgi:unsaturated chondroitin disaccharide hydrolase
VILKENLTASDLMPKIGRLWELSGPKIRAIDANTRPGQASPVFTVNGKYTAKGWTEWTQGFQFGSSILQFDATDDTQLLETAWQRVVDTMASHVSHMGVHDHGFNNVSTYGNLRRLMLEGRIGRDHAELAFYELALKVSAAVQARRWTQLPDGDGYIYSFNGPHSLFADTIRSLRSLAMGHQLGHALMEERDRKVNLLERLVTHARTTAKYTIYYGEGRDIYDVNGRVAHESVFNTNDGSYRCASTQQGYSAFTTWTRGLAWVMLGYPEQLEFLETISDEELAPLGGRTEIEAMMLRAAQAACDFYIENTPTDGIPYWDAGAPGLVHMGDYLDRPAEPFNDHEPVDSSAAAIGSQGLLRLGAYLQKKGREEDARRYWKAGLTVLDTLLDDQYLCADPSHEGLILHSVYHRPNGWDTIPEGARVPAGESSMWGDYHAREVALYVQRIVRDEPYYAFFGPVSQTTESNDNVQEEPA